MWLVAVVVAFAMQTPAAPAVRIVDKGDQSGVDAAKQVVVKTPEEWRALWRVHGMDRPLPPVDFSRETVVGLFMGSRPTAGFRIEIAGVDDADGARVVRYREQVPARDAMTAQVLTSPYVIAAIPKTAGAIRFEKAQ